MERGLKRTSIQANKTIEWSAQRITAALLFSQKYPIDFRGRRGRMIDPSNRQLAIELNQEAKCNGARLVKACEELHISVRTYECWVKGGEIQLDQRSKAKRPVPKKAVGKRTTRNFNGCEAR